MAGNENATVSLWNIEGPGEPRALPPIGGFSGGVAGVAFDPTGRILATAALDNSAQLWDISDPKRVTALATPLIGDADNLYGVAFHLDGHTLATSSHGQTVRLWETDADRAAAQICARVSSKITREEWSEYLPNGDYEPPCPARPAAVPADSESGTTTLIAVHSEKCIAIRAGVRVEDAPAYQFECEGLEAGRWRLQRATAPGQRPARYRISNVTTGMCLDPVLDERRFGSAHLIAQRACADDPSQLWEIWIVKADDDTAEGRFANSEYRDECLDVNGAAINDGAYLVRWRCGSNPNQVFRVTGQW